MLTYSPFLVFCFSKLIFLKWWCQESNQFFLCFQSIKEVDFRANGGTVIITNINGASEGKSLAANVDDLSSAPGRTRTWWKKTASCYNLVGVSTCALQGQTCVLICPSKWIQDKTFHVCEWSGWLCWWLSCGNLCFTFKIFYLRYVFTHKDRKVQVRKVWAFPPPHEAFAFETKVTRLMFRCFSYCYNKNYCQYYYTVSIMTTLEE